MGEARFWQGSGRHWHRLLGILLALALGLLPLPGDAVGALSLPWLGNPRGASPPLGVPATSALQEVAPPPGVQQLRRALEDRRPRLAIVAPADDALLPAGDWTLRLELEDWPLVDAAELGMGPHLLVQLDDGPVRPLLTLETVMPELSPGSHRLGVYAAWPWGEAVKAPGAWRQIRLHRVARNPLAVPAPGSPQLLAVAPAGPAAGEPVPLDALLIDTPLQNLRENDARWRLRITVNGDSFLVDRQQAIWLKGWREGANALQLELVDPRGEPLNPPFNSLVREVRLERSAPPPPWRRGRLSDGELARLLGEAPSPGPEPEAEPEPDTRPEAAADNEADSGAEAGAGADEPSDAPSDREDDATAAAEAVGEREILAVEEPAAGENRTAREPGEAVAEPPAEPAAPAEPSPPAPLQIEADDGPAAAEPEPEPKPEPAPEPEPADAGAAPPAPTPGELGPPPAPASTDRGTGTASTTATPPGPSPTPTEPEPELRQGMTPTAAPADPGNDPDPGNGDATGERADPMPPPASAPSPPEGGLLTRLRARLGR